MDVEASVDESTDDEEEQQGTCLTGFSSSAAVGNLLVAEESRDASTLLSVFDSDSDEEAKRPWGGSLPGKSPNVARDFQGVHDRLHQWCFAGENSLHTEGQFKRRF